MKCGWYWKIVKIMLLVHGNDWSSSMCCSKWVTVSSKTSYFWCTATIKITFCAWSHKAFATPIPPHILPPPPSKSTNICTTISFIWTPYKSFYSIVNSIENYLWGFEIFNTIFKRPLNVVYTVVMLPLTNSIIVVDEHLANAPVSFQNSIA